MTVEQIATDAVAFAKLGAGIAIGFGTIGAGLGIGIATKGFLESIARQPEIFGKALVFFIRLFYF